MREPDFLSLRYLALGNQHITRDSQNAAFLGEGDVKFLQAYWIISERGKTYPAINIRIKKESVLDT